MAVSLLENISVEKPALELPSPNMTKKKFLCLWTKIRLLDDNALFVKRLAVTLGLMVISQSCSMANMINTSFLVPHFSARNITGIVSGLIGSGVGFGYIIGHFLDIFGRLYHERGLQLRTMLLWWIVWSTATCLFYAFSKYIVHNAIFSAISLGVRVSAGVASHWCFITLIEAVRVWLPDQFQLVNSLVVGTGGYIGYALGSILGGVLYEEFGYSGPYIMTSLYMGFVFLVCYSVLPGDQNPVYTHHPLEEKKSSVSSTESESEEKLPQKKEDPLSPLVFLPLLAQMLINLAGGYIVITAVPFLIHCCDLSIRHASSFIMLYSLTIALGFFVSGMLSQHRLISHYSQAILGGMCVILGLLLMYPSPTLDAIYSNSHYVGYLAILFTGIGDPLHISVTISTMESLQTDFCKRTLSSKQRCDIGSFWAIGWMVASYGGMFIAGVFMDTVTFEVGGWIMASLSFLGVSISFMLRLLQMYSTKRLEYIKGLLSVV